MNNYLAIVADIKEKIQAVPGVGKVHDYARLATDWGTYIARFKDESGRILGWEITRARVSEHRRGATFRHHTFVLRGFMGLQDSAATDKLFQALVEEVCAAFRDTAAPLSAPWSYQNADAHEQTPTQVPVIDERMFGQVLCHYAEIHLSITERILPV